MKIEVTQVGRGSRPYRGTVNDEPFIGRAGFCRLVAELATPDDGCIEGIGAPLSDGYHRAQVGKWAGKQHALVRAFYEGLERPPEGLHAAHGPCHDRACVSPHHVEFKAAWENQQDRLRDGTDNGGERNGRSKVTDVERAEIQRLHATGRYTQRELAKRFGISPVRVHQIVNAPTWRIVPMTPDRAAMIRFITATAPYTARQVAEACNTTEQQVRNIKHGRTWQPRKAVQP